MTTTHATTPTNSNDIILDASSTSALSPGVSPGGGLDDAQEQSLSLQNLSRARRLPALPPEVIELEHTRFEAWIGLNDRLGPQSERTGDSYDDNYVSEMWEAWLARARLAYVSVTPVTQTTLVGDDSSTASADPLTIIPLPALPPARACRDVPGNERKSELLYGLDQMRDFARASVALAYPSVNVGSLHASELSVRILAMLLRDNGFSYSGDAEREKFALDSLHAELPSLISRGAMSRSLAVSIRQKTVARFAMHMEQSLKDDEAALFRLPPSAMKDVALASLNVARDHFETARALMESIDLKPSAT